MRALSLFTLVPFFAEAYHYYYAPYYIGYPYQIATFASQSEKIRNVEAVALTRNSNGGDIVANTRFFSNQVQATLRQLADYPASSAIVNRIINDKDNICLRNLEEGIAAIETATKLVERSGDDIKNLNDKVNSFITLTDPATVVRAVADILRVTEPLIMKITPDNITICEASSNQAFGSLRSIASLCDELSTTDQLSLSIEVRRQLVDSARKISTVATFLNRLRSVFSRIEQICTPDRQYNIKAISSLGDLMVYLGDLFATLGEVHQGEKIRKGKEFVNKVVAQINKIENIGLGKLDCNKQGDFSSAAKTMEDLATIIDEVGIEQLEKQLGVDLSFVFNE